MTETLATEGLAVGYRRRRRERVLLSDLDLALAPGELTCLLGPNGCGKSTLLRTLAGMQAPLSGRVRLGGEDVGGMDPRARARRLAVVLTDPVDTGLLRTVDLVALGRYPHAGWDGKLDAADVEAVRWALRVTGAEGFADRAVAELSDGERQRAMLARALAQNPVVLALDEPVAFVDLPRRVELVALLRDLARECGLAVLMTTHDLDLALRSADTLWLVRPDADLSDRLRVGAPEDLALDGSVAAAFGAGDMVFDPLRATFLAPARGLARVRVTGDEVGAAWAARALEREGLTAVTDGPADLTVAATGQEWRLSAPDGEFVFGSVGELARCVRDGLPSWLARPQASAGDPTGERPRRAAGRSVGEA